MNTAERNKLVIGTRRSKLARWQTDHVIGLLKSMHPGLELEILTFATEGDQKSDVPLGDMGGRGVFTRHLETALEEGHIDFAVHSLKDLPTEEDEALAIAAITRREDARDCVVSKDNVPLQQLPHGAVIGTSSTRREAQLRRIRDDFEFRVIRGNVDTRIRKVREGAYDATILAAAGIRRLGLKDEVCEWLATSLMLPAPGQAALAVQCRRGDREVRRLLRAIDDKWTRKAVVAERAFLEALGGGCSLPVAALAKWQEKSSTITLRGAVLSRDGSRQIEVTGSGSDPIELGSRLASDAVDRGALDVLGIARALPLSGKRIAVTRAQHQSHYLCERLRRLGAEPLLMPAIQIESLTDDEEIDDAIDHLSQYDWVVFTSANAVHSFAQIASARLAQATTRIAAVGPKTAQELERHGLRAHVVPPRFTADDLASALGDVAGNRILMPRADIAHEDAVEDLRSRGAQVTPLVVYRTTAAPLSDAALAELRNGIDVVTFTSGSTVRNFIAALKTAGMSDVIDGDCAVACVGAVTAEVAHEENLRTDIVPDNYTVDGMVDAIVQFFDKGEIHEQ